MTVCFRLALLFFGGVGALVAPSRRIGARPRRAVVQQSLATDFVVALSGDGASAGDPFEIGLAIGSVSLLVFVITAVLYLEYDEKVKTPKITEEKTKPAMPKFSELEMPAAVDDEDLGEGNRGIRRFQKKEARSQARRKKRGIAKNADRPIG